jgi:hypothetical protein
MRFDAGTFDRTMSLLVLNFIPDAVKAVDETKRETRRGGIIAAALWDYDEGMEMLRVFWDEAGANVYIGACVVNVVAPASRRAASRPRSTVRYWTWLSRSRARGREA